MVVVAVRSAITDHAFGTRCFTWAGIVTCFIEHRGDQFKQLTERVMQLIIRIFLSLTVLISRFYEGVETIQEGLTATIREVLTDTVISSRCVENTVGATCVTNQHVNKDNEDFTLVVVQATSQTVNIVGITETAFIVERYFYLTAKGVHNQRTQVRSLWSTSAGSKTKKERPLYPRYRTKTLSCLRSYVSKGK
ncbi:hypothetical protein SPFM20_00243 [Salmonella phage SPFM20]|nr:hypothetical protein SPFM8_00243 [Salmonella phage SPFM8]VFR14921.1 hypothetical protein SPFM20_00243 [Salmonella phage SPFM20]